MCIRLGDLHPTLSTAKSHRLPVGLWGTDFAGPWLLYLLLGPAQLAPYIFHIDATKHESRVYEVKIFFYGSIHKDD